MNNSSSYIDASGDLFAKMPVTRGGATVVCRPPPEMTAARALCRQLRRKQALRDKQRIAHLICLNLLTILRRGS